MPEFAWPATPPSRSCWLPKSAVLTTAGLQKVQQALWLGASVEQLYEITAIDPWFLEQIAGINAMADQIRAPIGCPRACCAGPSRPASPTRRSPVCEALRGRDSRRAACAGDPPGVQDRRHLRRGVSRLHAVPLLPSYDAQTEVEPRDKGR